jgi:hypothetical protein
MVLDLAILTFAASRQAPVMRDIIARAVPRFLWPVALLASLFLIHSVPMKALALLAVSAFSAWMIWNEWHSGHIVLVEPETQLT